MTNDPTATRPGPPPLRIHHFLAWMAVSAVMLSFRQFLPFNKDALSLWGGFAVVYLTINTAGLTSAGFSIFWWRKGFAALNQPGQWLLLRFVPSSLYHLCHAAIYLLQTSYTGWSPWRKDLLIWEPRQWGMLLRQADILTSALLLFGVPLIIYAWGTWRIADTRPWRMYYGVMTLLSLLNLVSYISTSLFGVFGWQSSTGISWIYGLVGPACFLLMNWAAIDDFATRPRFWTHWFGVGLVAGTFGLELLGSLIVLLSE